MSVVNVYKLIGLNVAINYQFNLFYKKNIDNYKTDEEPTHFINTFLYIPKIDLPIVKQTRKKRFYEDDQFDYVSFVDDKNNILNIIKRKKDFKQYDIYINPTQENLAGLEYTIHQMVFMEMALNHGFIPIHSSAFNYKDKAVLITAPSGVGKSTLSNRMHKLYNLDIINDDKPLLRLENDNIYVYSSPFSGKEAKNINTILPLGLIVFLKRGENKLKFIHEKEAINELVKNVFRPNENDLWDLFIDIANRTINEEKIIQFEASNSDEAAQTLYTYLKEKL